MSLIARPSCCFDYLDQAQDLQIYRQQAGEDCSFQITVISDAFAKQTAVKRQQSILALFNDALRSGELHALTIKAYTPQEHASFSPPGLTQISL